MQEHRKRRSDRPGGEDGSAGEGREERRSSRPRTGPPSGKSASKPPAARVIRADGPFGEALHQAAAAPERDELWDAVEDLAAAQQRPGDVAELYRELLKGDLPRDVAVAVGDRATRFLGEWFEDTSPQIEILRRVVQIDPSVTWAFDRLSVLYTAAERWSELLTLYDEVLPLADAPRRLLLLQEAARAAKDFAGDGARAIDYFTKLFELKPSDPTIASSLERLLEREKRHAELIKFWTLRAPLLPDDAAQAVRARMASCYLDHLGDPGSALEVAAPLLDDETFTETARQLVERVLAFPTSSPEVRASALGALRTHYGKARRQDDVVRVLEIALDFAERSARADLHREIAALLRKQDKDVEAVAHYAALVVLEPGSNKALVKLQKAAELTNQWVRYAEALAEAADVSGEPGRAIELLVEAADTRVDKLSDTGGAVELYGRVLATPEADRATVLAVARKQRDLLEQRGDRAALLDVLERLVGLEPEANARRDLLGRAAQLATDLGEVERALAAWRARLDEDAADREALDAVVEILDGAGRHDELVAALRARAAAPADDGARRADLVRVARIYGTELGRVADAIEGWLDVERVFGQETETVRALSDLLEREGRWGDLADLLARAVASESDPAHRVELQHRLGDTHRVRLGAPELALEHYRQAAAEDPRHAGVRAGLAALAEDESCRAAAIQALDDAFVRSDDWESRVRLLEHRLAIADDDPARTRVLRETATLQEERGNDPLGALESLRRAMALSPMESVLESELLRLAEATGAWQKAVDAYREALAALRADSTSEDDDPPRALDLLRQLGTILERESIDLAGALEAYQAIFRRRADEVETADAVVRASARLGRWAVASGAVVQVTEASAGVPESSLATLETVAAEASAWDEATRALAEALSAAPDLPAALARELDTRVAVWHRDRRGDPDAAELALLRAHDRSGASVETLRMLAALQRRAPGRPLVETLLQLSAASEGSVDPLYEAAEVTMGVLGDAALARSILEKVLAEASNHWVTAVGRDLARLEWFASWALDHLVRAAIGEQDYARAIELLVEGAWLPFIKEKARGMIHQAAAIAANDLGDVPRAIELYKSILERAPDDGPAIERLGGLYEATGRLDELLALRRHELGLEPPAEQRLVLRLEIADLLGRLGDEDGRVTTLLANLGDQPGHAPTLGQLGRVFEAQGRHAELADVLIEQARALEEAADRQPARDLWARAADLAEHRLNDVARALDCQRRAVDIAPTASSLDALARLHSALGEHALAVKWLEQRLAGTDPGQAAPVVARLAAEHEQAGDPERARACLEDALAADPDAHELRKQLAALYRASSTHPELVVLLLDGAARAPSDPERLEQLREAGQLLQDELDRPEDAVPVLREAVELDPTDRPTRMRFADALRVTGELDEAETLLEGIVQDFGRRRPRERAEVHYQVARVAAARGKLPDAIKQLELAAGMDVEHVGVFRMLADAYRDANDIERAERTYRTLLLLVLRGAPGAADIGSSGVYLELYRISKRLEHHDRAAEVLESAFEAAQQSEAEALRFEDALRAAGENAILLRALERRLEKTTDPALRAPIVAEIADVLDLTPGREIEALEARLDALAGAPDSARLHEAARAAALRANAAGRYAALLTELADKSDGAGEREVAGDLFLRLGEVLEQDLGDRERARDIYAKVEDMLGEDSGARPERQARRLAVWRALERIAAALGDKAGQARALRLIIHSGADEDAGPEHNEQLYRLAEMELGSPETVASGIESLEAAIDRDPQHERALAMLRKAAEEMPDEAALVALYERIARASEDPATLLDALDRSARLPDASVDGIAEAVEIATKLGRTNQAEALLVRAVEVARGADLSRAAWALIDLADRHEARGELGESARFLREAAGVSEAADATRLLQRVATLAAGPLSDLPLAAQTYSELLERDPGDRGIWEPMLEVYRRLGDPSELEKKLATVADSVYDAEERGRLRMERARILLGDESRGDDAVDALRQMLDEDPDDEEAARILMEFCERTSRTDTLIELLQRQLDAAQTRSDGEAVVSLALRVGALMKPSQPREAVDVVRSAIEWAPDPRKVLEPLLALIGPEGEASERADVLEKLLALDQGEKAVERTLALVAARQEADDDGGVERALETGLRICPGHPKLRARLAKYFTDTERWGRLAEMIVDEAAALEPKAAVARLREAATIYRDTLGNAGAAALVLRKALDKEPDDVALVVECARCLAKAGEFELAAQDVSAALERLQDDGSTRSELLRLRAELRTSAGQDALALEDLEEAFSITSTLTSWPATPIAPDLAAALERRRVAAADAGDAEAERAATLRLVELRTQAGEAAAARDLLVEWTDKAPDDVPAQRQLLELEAAAKNWTNVAAIAGHLVALDQGEYKVACALRLAEAYEALGQLAEARVGLEAAHAEVPGDGRVRELLLRIYEAAGAHHDLALMHMAEGRAAQNDDARFSHFRRAGEIWLDVLSDASSAVEVLQEARAARPGDHDTIALLADAYTAAGYLNEATALLEEAIAAHKGRRSPQLAALQHRMARVAVASGDRNVEAAWLNAALDSDGKNADVAADLADAATEIGELDLALKALRAVSLLKSPRIPRAVAYLRQGMIHWQQGDQKRAVLMAKRAQAEDNTLAEAGEFLAKIGR